MWSNELLSPPPELGVIPFWFWNDALDEAELLRQIDDFQQHGVAGFVIHPRVGLPRRLGWMSEDLLRFYAIAIEEAARRRMTVLLYDEGMYPSGSSSGQRPRLQDGETLAGLVQRANGAWLAIIDRPARSVIRGLHYTGETETGDRVSGEDEPPAADILNPQAVETFIKLVYDRFAEHFQEHFDQTILAIFTDEPGLLGRSRERDIWPGTTGILPHIERLLGYDFTPHLPALWYDDEPQAEYYRREYRRAVHLRLEETYYQPLATWCEAHGVALTGHPHQGDAIGPLRYFQIPGQDLVWRWVLPDQPSALEGPESTQAKCAASAMLHHGRRRNANECCGAYGHELTWEEMNWLANWGFVRGLNLVIPHAFYYSVRGVRRDERPPDVGPHSAWWERFLQYALACRRLSWLNTDSQHLCELAILGQSDWLPWRSARACYQHQWDFNYLEERDLLAARVDADGIHLVGMTYRVLILEHEPGAQALAHLAPLLSTGRVFRYGPETRGDALTAWLEARLPTDVRVSPPSPALRVRHILKHTCHYYMVFNEERRPQDCRLELSGNGAWQVFDPLSGATQDLPPGQPLHLEGHALLVIGNNIEGQPIS